ncbi:MAG: hypothetical protein QNJ00_13250 [Woeseiaceae bacterium]|nr:hypothetical protein [Woeseiaceae bacterium]
MALSLRLVDETTSGEVYNETVLKLVSTRISVRDLIEQRVREEVRRFNDEKADKLFAGLVQPRDAEQQLNGFRLKKMRQIDADAQVKIALEAFENNGFFLLVDDRQVESLDEEFGVSENTKVTFMKLIPVVGG